MFCGDLERRHPVQTSQLPLTVKPLQYFGMLRVTPEINSWRQSHSSGKFYDMNYCNGFAINGNRVIKTIFNRLLLVSYYWHEFNFQYFCVFKIQNRSEFKITEFFRFLSLYAFKQYPRLTSYASLLHPEVSLCKNSWFTLKVFTARNTVVGKMRRITPLVYRFFCKNKM